VEDNLLLPVWAAGRGDGRERVESIYGRIPELRPLASRRAAALSGGQQKMVALARALVTGTSLLLLDEPFEGLSPALAGRLAEVIRVLTGLAVLVTESDETHVRRLTDRIYTMERGEIVARP
jgi:branched-chain amino acid transport system ATP-binding protein